MLKLRQRIFTIIGVISAIFIAVILSFYVFKSSESQDEENTDTTTVTTLPLVAPDYTTAPVVGNEKPSLPPEEEYAKLLARIFVERFSTYSNQNDNQHIRDAQSHIASEIGDWVSGYILEQGETYYGVTTEVLSSSLESFDAEDGKARVYIEAQQTILEEQEDGTLEENTEIKTANVDIKKVGQEWRVNGLWWLE